MRWSPENRQPTIPILPSDGLFNNGYNTLLTAGLAIDSASLARFTHDELEQVVFRIRET